MAAKPKTQKVYLAFRLDSEDAYGDNAVLCYTLKSAQMYPYYLEINAPLKVEKKSVKVGTITI